MTLGLECAQWYDVSNDHDLRHLASALEALTERLEHRIPIARAHRCHVQRLTDRPGGNATGTNSFSVEVLAKRLALLVSLSTMLCGVPFGAKRAYHCEK
jgi:hypothetical protein